MKATESFDGVIKMEKTEHTWPGSILLGIFVVLLAWYFLAAYMDHGKSPPVEEKLLTVHDDLLAIDGPGETSKTAVGKFGLILTTQDGGKTWQRRKSGTVKTLSSISFADRQHGFVVGSGGTLLATKDGGLTWLAQKSGTEDQLLGVHAVSPLRVFAVGAFGTLLSTSDGGQSWSRHDLKWDSLIEKVVKETGYVEPNLNAIYFTSANFGWIVGEFGLVLHTQDGGQTWVSQRYGSDFPQLYAIELNDDRTALAVGQAGSIIQTNDGGKTWHSVELESKRDFYDVSFIRGRSVIVGDGVVYVNNPGGSDWKTMDLKEQGRWFTGVSAASGDAIAVGQGGTTVLLPLEKVSSEKKE